VCGYDSKGNEDQCVVLTSFVPPSYGIEECRPGCMHEADCQAIHPALHCFGYASQPKGLCDYDTKQWEGPMPPKP
jgi:hypothetical protein